MAFHNALYTIFAIISLWLLPMYSAQLSAQTIFTGQVVDEVRNPVPGVSVQAEIYNLTSVSDENGLFKFSVQNDPDSIFLTFKHISFESSGLWVKLKGDIIQEVFIIKSSTRLLDNIEVRSGGEMIRSQAGTFQLDPSAATDLPSPFLDISALLQSLPGVTGYGELSTAYAVRGGNYDENLIYVNDMPVYRPFIIRAGEQEGLSFVNPDLTDNVVFSSGGWQSRYGDRLSSNLSVHYKTPVRTGGSANISLLGGGAHIEGLNRKQNFTYLAGIRHKASRYLLGTLEIEGQYFPNFTDFQSYFEYTPGKNTKKNPTTIGLMLAHSNNRYLIEPESRESTFGTFSDQKRLFVAFNGRELMNYDTYQGSINIKKRFGQRFNTTWVIYSFFTREREYFDVESGYRLCDVEIRPSEEQLSACVLNRSIGSEFRSGRNQLDALVSGMEQRSELVLSEDQKIEFGFSLHYQEINDVLREYSFTDSAGFTRMNYTIDQVNQIDGAKVDFYLQHSLEFAGNHRLTYGARTGYFDINRQWIFSPRAQYAWQPPWKKNMVLRFSAGIYQQPPFYREFRNFEGQINSGIRAQSSLHLIGGTDYQFELWGRPFKLMTEAYYKYLWNVVPYDIDNVRLRYYAQNMGVAYAAGIDFRVSGDFIPGDESWFSLGILQTQENIEGDPRGFIPRPSDQRINAAIFFRDHIPNKPDFKVNFAFFYASPLPFSPPGVLELRNSFRGRHYMRADLGFQKIFTDISDKTMFLGVKSWSVGMEILNLTGSQNPISYLWISDVNRFSYAVPNALSARFLNVRLTGRF
ncbi:MAG: TonB-dependent receptor plug domain-containing protein [Cyclobacteriaceae bacterium]|nr:TonB-dependent receptor plug domain-containing protein [Cyclobacteriaceae bacterium]